MISAKESAAIDNFLNAWKEKGYTKDARQHLGIIAGSRQAVIAFGDTATSFNTFADITLSSKSEQEAIDSFINLIYERQ